MKESITFVLIPNKELRLADVPDDTADLHSLSKLALTFDGNADYPANFKVFSDTREAFSSGTANLNLLNLTELRTCLFYEQRLHKWQMDGPGYEPDVSFMLALLRAIRANLARAVQSGQPFHVFRRRRTDMMSIAARVPLPCLRSFSAACGILSGMLQQIRELFDRLLARFLPARLL